MKIEINKLNVNEIKWFFAITKKLGVKQRIIEKPREAKSVPDPDLRTPLIVIILNIKEVVLDLYLSLSLSV